MNRKYAIVTGAAKGIGETIARRLSKDGFYLIMIDVDEKGGMDLERDLGPDKGVFYQVDISDEQQVHDFFENINNEFGKVDVLVNNAGIIRDNIIWKMPLEDFDKVLNVNLRGTWLMSKAVSIMMKEQGFGRIVNITSRAWLGNAGQSNYSASKAGIVGLTRVLALELGRYNVLVNAVAPGLIDTPLTRGLSEEIRRKLIEAQPTRSIGSPEDVAHLVSFLSSEKTHFITGQVIYVDGGKSIGAN